MHRQPSENEQEHNWTTFGDWFSAFFTDFLYRPQTAECAWKVERSRMAIDADFLRAETRFNADVEEAIQQICRGGAEATASRVSPEVAYLLGLRVEVVGCFLLRMDSESPASNAQKEIISTIIPFPSLPPLRVAEWFLRHWWRCNGPQMLCEMQFIEETLPPE